MNEETPGAGRHARPDDTPTVDGAGSGSDAASDRPTESGDATAAYGSDETATVSTSGEPEDRTVPTSPATAAHPADHGDADDTVDTDTARRGRVRYQDPEHTTPREPTVAEQRARRETERRRQAQDEAAAAAEERKRKTRKRVLVGGGVAVGLVALVAIVYAASSSDDRETSAQCTDQNGRVVEDRFCSGTPVSGSYGGGFVPIFLGGVGNQYHYNYGSNTPIGGTVNGGTTRPPASGTTLRGSSGSTIGPATGSGTVARGGLGVGGSGSSGSGSSGSGSSGSSGGS